jgi:dTMP kinase
MSARGFFLTLEGGEGTGKSTLAAGLEATLRATGRACVRTREPGGSPGGDAIRELLVKGAVERWSVLSETMLLTAARNAHLEHTITPALAAGQIVICDRYVDSTQAYQVAGRGLPLAAFHMLNDLIAAPKPDLTFILDLDPVLGVGRSTRGGALQEDRFERMPSAFHQRVREAFLQIATQEPLRCVVIDAAMPAESVLAQVLATLESRLSQKS